ncbi:MAG: gas vesicle protein GvpD P-loop domain-containing protein [Thermoplasmata archaeon]
MQSGEVHGKLPKEVINFLETEGGHSLIVKGSAGTGKTTFSLQLIEDLKGLQNSYYLSTRVSDESLYLQFPWLKKKIEESMMKVKEKAEKLNVDRTELRKLEGQIELGEADEMGSQYHGDVDEEGIVLDLGSYLPEVDVIYDTIEEALPRKTLVVIDSINALSERYGIPAPKLINTFQKDLVESTRANVIYVLESSKETSLDYLGDGVISLFHSSDRNGRRIRLMDIQKLRGCEIPHSKFLYTLLGGRLRVFGPQRFNGFAISRQWQSLVDPNEYMISTGCRELDDLLDGGLRRGSINMIEIGDNIHTEHADIFENSLVSNFASMNRGVVWIPAKKGTSKSVKEELGPQLKDHALEDNVRVYEKYGERGADGLYHQIEGKDVSQDLEWRTAKYDLSKSESPVLLLAGFDTMESIYATNSLVEDLSDVLTFIRRMGDIFVGITTPSTISTQRLADLTRTHIKLENIGGTTVVYCEKPHTGLYALEVTTDNGYPMAKLAPIL